MTAVVWAGCASGGAPKRATLAPRGQLPQTLREALELPDDLGAPSAPTSQLMSCPRQYALWVTRAVHGPADTEDPDRVDLFRATLRWQGDTLRADEVVGWRPRQWSQRWRGAALGEVKPARAPKDSAQAASGALLDTHEVFGLAPLLSALRAEAPWRALDGGEVEVLGQRARWGRWRVPEREEDTRSMIGVPQKRRTYATLEALISADGALLAARHTREVSVWDGAQRVDAQQTRHHLHLTTACGQRALPSPARPAAPSALPPVISRWLAAQPAQALAARRTLADASWYTDVMDDPDAPQDGPGPPPPHKTWHITAAWPDGLRCEWQVRRKDEAAYEVYRDDCKREGAGASQP